MFPCSLLDFRITNLKIQSNGGYIKAPHSPHPPPSPPRKNFKHVIIIVLNSVTDAYICRDVVYFSRCMQEAGIVQLLMSEKSQAVYYISSCHMLIDKALSSDKPNGHWFETDWLHCKRDALSSNQKVDGSRLTGSTQACHL